MVDLPEAESPVNQIRPLLWLFISPRPESRDTFVRQSLPNKKSASVCVGLRLKIITEFRSNLKQNALSLL
jgi:hypothetical protein